jgi:hypothetical protein
MIGKKSGFKALLNPSNEKCSKLLNLHCIIHLETLCAKKFLSMFNNVITDVSKIINYIRGRSLLHREFKLVLTKSGLDDNDLIYYCDVRWLSKGEMSHRFYRLIPDLKVFFKST